MSNPQSQQKHQVVNQQPEGLNSQAFGPDYGRIEKSSEAQKFTLDEESYLADLDEFDVNLQVSQKDDIPQVKESKDGNKELLPTQDPNSEPKEKFMGVSMDDFDNLKTSSMGQNFFSAALHQGPNIEESSNFNSNAYYLDQHQLEPELNTLCYNSQNLQNSSQLQNLESLQIQQKALNTNQEDLRNSLLNFDKRLDKIFDSDTLPKSRKNVKPKKVEQLNQAEIQRQEIIKKIEELKSQLQGTNDYIQKNIKNNSSKHTSRDVSPNHSFMSQKENLPPLPKPYPHKYENFKPTATRVESIPVSSKKKIDVESPKGNHGAKIPQLNPQIQKFLLEQSRQNGANIQDLQDAYMRYISSRRKTSPKSFSKNGNYDSKATNGLNNSELADLQLVEKQIDYETYQIRPERTHSPQSPISEIEKEIETIQRRIDKANLESEQKIEKNQAYLKGLNQSALQNIQFDNNEHSMNQQTEDEGDSQMQIRVRDTFNQLDKDATSKSPKIQKAPQSATLSIRMMKKPVLPPTLKQSNAITEASNVFENTLNMISEPKMGDSPSERNLTVTKQNVDDDAKNDSKLNHPPLSPIQPNQIVQSLKLALSNTNNALSEAELNQISSILSKLHNSNSEKKSMGTQGEDDLVYSMKSTIAKSNTCQSQAFPQAIEYGIEKPNTESEQQLNDEELNFVKAKKKLNIEPETVERQTFGTHAAQKIAPTQNCISPNRVLPVKKEIEETPERYQQNKSCKEIIRDSIKDLISPFKSTNIIQKAPNQNLTTDFNIMMNMTDNAEVLQAQNELSNVIGLGLSDIHQTADIYFNSQQNPLEVVHKVKNQIESKSSRTPLQKPHQLVNQQMKNVQQNHQRNEEYGFEQQPNQSNPSIQVQNAQNEDLNPSLATLLSTLTICKENSVKKKPQTGQDNYYRSSSNNMTQDWIKDRYAQKECFLYTFFTDKLKPTLRNIFKNEGFVS